VNLALIPSLACVVGALIVRELNRKRTLGKPARATNARSDLSDVTKH
jgi:hypothetical protein